MKDFRNWNVRENWWQNLQNAGQQLFNPQQPQPKSPPQPAPGAAPGGAQPSPQPQPQPQQQPPQPQQPVPDNPDDPKIREQKYKKFRTILGGEFFSNLSLSGPAHKSIEKSLDNLAKSFTLGYRLHVRDLDEILLALHTTQGVHDVLTGHTFSDHYRVLAFVKQVFDHNSEVWYNPSAQKPEGRLPPGMTINDAELSKYMQQWSKSPFRKSAKSPNEQAQPNLVGVPKTGQELIEWIKKSFTNPQRIAGAKSANPVSKFKGIFYEEDWDLLAREMGKLFNITLTEAELDQLRGIT